MSQRLEMEPTLWTDEDLVSGNWAALLSDTELVTRAFATAGTIGDFETSDPASASAASADHVAALLPRLPQSTEVALLSEWQQHAAAKKTSVALEMNAMRFKVLKEMLGNGAGDEVQPSGPFEHVKAVDAPLKEKVEDWEERISRLEFELFEFGFMADEVVQRERRMNGRNHVESEDVSDSAANEIFSETESVVERARQIVLLALAVGAPELAIQAVSQVENLIRKFPDAEIALPVSLMKQMLNYRKEIRVSALWKHCIVDRFSEIPKSEISVKKGKAIVCACDGSYLYTHGNRGLIKTGSGRGGTVKGKIYLSNSTYRIGEQIRMIYCNKKLWVITDRFQWPLLETVDVDTLQPSELYHLGIDPETSSPSASMRSKNLFADDRFIYIFAREKRSPIQVMTTVSDDKDTGFAPLQSFEILPSSQQVNDAEVDKFDLNLEHESIYRPRESSLDSRRVKKKSRKDRKRDKSGELIDHRVVNVLYVYDTFKPTIHGSHVVKDSASIDDFMLDDEAIKVRQNLAEQLWMATGYHFSKSSCIIALKSSSDDLNAAAKWLLDFGEQLRNAYDIPLEKKIDLVTLETLDTSIDVVDRSPVLLNGHQFTIIIQPHTHPWTPSSSYLVRTYNLKDGAFISDIQRNYHYFSKGNCLCVDLNNSLIWNVGSEDGNLNFTAYENPAPRYDLSMPSRIPCFSLEAILTEILQNSTSAMVLLSLRNVALVLHAFLRLCDTVRFIDDPDVNPSLISSEIPKLEEQLRSFQKNSMVESDIQEIERITTELEKKKKLLQIYRVSPVNDRLMARSFSFHLDPHYVHQVIQGCICIHSYLLQSDHDFEYVYKLEGLLNILNHHIFELLKLQKPNLDEFNWECISSILLELALNNSIAPSLNKIARILTIEGARIFFHEADAYRRFILGFLNQSENSLLDSSFRNELLGHLCQSSAALKLLLQTQANSSLNMFLQSLFSHAFNPDSFFQSSDISVEIQLLLAIQKTILRDYSLCNNVHENGVSILLDYTRLAIRQSVQLIGKVARVSEVDCITNGEEILKRSLYLILPTLLAVISKDQFLSEIDDPHFFGDEIFLLLDSLVQYTGRTSKFLAGSALASSLMKGQFEDFIVETSHPYPSGQNLLREQIDIPGADALVLYFDPLSSTKNSSDSLTLFKDSALIQPLSVGPFYGNSGDRNSKWPSHGVFIPGNSVCFLFSARSQPIEGDSSRWGFRCLVRGLSIRTCHWTIDLVNSLSDVYSKISQYLISGISPPSACEEELVDWMKIGIFTQGLEKDSSDVNRFLLSFVDGENPQLQADFADHGSRFFGQRVLSSLGVEIRNKWNRSIRCLAAACFKHSGILESLIEAYNPGILNRVDDQIRQKVKQISTLVHDHQSWMMRQVQLYKEWCYALVDVDMDFKKFRQEFGHPDKIDSLEDICALKRVDFCKKDIEGAISKLFELYEKEKLSGLQIASAEINRFCYTTVIEYVYQVCHELLSFVNRSHIPTIFSPGSLLSHGLDPPQLSRAHSSLDTRWHQQYHKALNNLTVSLQEKNTSTTLESDISGPLPVFERLPTPLMGRAVSAPDDIRVSPRSNIDHFNDRVHHLRYWIENYRKWSSWKRSRENHESFVGNSSKREASGLIDDDDGISKVVGSIILLMRLNLPPRSLVEIALVQRKRGFSRLRGLRMLNKALKFSENDIVMFNIIGSLGHALLSHQIESVEDTRFEKSILSSLQLVPDDLQQKLMLEFEALVDHRLRILNKNNVLNPILKMYSLTDLYLFEYKVEDYHLLTDKKFLESLESQLMPCPSFPDTDTNMLSKMTVSFWSAYKFFCLRVFQWNTHPLKGKSARFRVQDMRSRILDSCFRILRTCASYVTNSVGSRNAHLPLESLLSFVHLLKLSDVSTHTSLDEIPVFVQFNRTEILLFLFQLIDSSNKFTPKLLVSAIRLIRFILPMTSPGEVTMPNGQTIPFYILNKIGRLLYPSTADDLISPAAYHVVGHFSEKISSKKWDKILQDDCKAFFDSKYKCSPSQEVKDKLLKQSVVDFEDRKKMRKLKSNSSRVKLEIKAGNANISDNDGSFTATGGFTTIVADVCVTAGKWYYEMIISSPGIKQVGWCTDKMNADPKRNGVGDDVFSWAFDGNRLKKWHVHPTSYGGGVPWKTGDVLGVLLDIDNRTISFTLNDEDLGIAFKDFRLDGKSCDENNESVGDDHGIGLFPAASCSHGESGKFIFNLNNFVYNVPEGYYPLEGDKPFLHEVNMLKRVKKMRNAIQQKGHCSLFEGSRDDCNTLADIIHKAGGLVTISTPENLKKYAYSDVFESIEARSSSHLKTNIRGSKRVYNGYSSNILISELVSLGRLLSSHVSSSSEWRTAFSQSMLSSFNALFNNVAVHPSQLSSNCDDILSGVGSLCIMGGFSENLRFGGSVSLARKDRGLILSVLESCDNSLVLIHDSLEGIENISNALQRISIDVLEPCSEFNFSFESFPNREAIISRLLSLGSLYDSSAELNSWMVKEVPVRSIQILSRIVMDPVCDDILDISSFYTIMDLLLSHASKCPLGIKINEVVQQVFALHNHLSDLSTNSADSFAPLPHRPMEIPNVDTGILPIFQQYSSSHQRELTEEEKEICDAVFLYSSSSFDKEYSESSNTFIRENKLLKYWEKHIIPRIQNYVKSSFQKYEMEYFFESLRQPLRSGNQEAAVKIAYTLCGGRLPDFVTIPSSDTDWTGLMIEDVNVGQILQVTSSTEASDDIDFLLGRLGRVISIEPRAEVLCLEFYFEELACLQYGWFPVEGLAVPTFSPYFHSFYDYTHDMFSGSIEQNCRLLAGLYSRNALFHVYSSQRKLSVKQISSEVDHPVQKILDMFALSVSEQLELASVENPGIIPDGPTKNSAIRTLESNLLSMIASLRVNYSITEIRDSLLKYVRTIVQGAADFILSNIAYKSCNSWLKSEDDSIETQPVCFHVKGASGLLLIFSIDASLEPNTSLVFFSDFACTKVIRSFSGKQNGSNMLKSFLIPQDRFYVKRSALSLGIIKFKVQILPISFKFGVSFWIMNWFLTRWLTMEEDPLGFCCTLIEIIMKHFHISELPASDIKEAVIRLISRVLTRILHMSPSTMDSPLLRAVLDSLKSLHEEMIDVVGKEFALDFFSSFSQQIMNLSIIADTLRSSNEKLCDESYFPRETKEFEKSTPEIITEAPSGWACIICTFLNNEADTICSMCDSPKPPEPPKAVVNLLEMQADDSNKEKSRLFFQDMVCLLNLVQYFLGQKSRHQVSILKPLFEDAFNELRQSSFLKKFVLIQNIAPSSSSHDKSFCTKIRESLMKMSKRVDRLDVRIDTNNFWIINQQLLDEPNEPSLKVSDTYETSFVYESDFDTNGLIYHIGTVAKTRTWRNPADGNAVIVTGSPLLSDSKPISFSIGREATRVVTKPIANAWIQISFSGIEVSPSHYSLRHFSSSNSDALRNWIFQGSVDGITWISLSAHSKDESLTKKGSSKTWLIPDESTNGAFMSHFRILQTGSNSSGNNSLALSGFEIYGKTRGPNLKLRPPVRESPMFAIVYLNEEDEQKVEDFIHDIDGQISTWNFDFPTELKARSLAQVDETNAQFQQFLRCLVHDKEGNTLNENVLSLLSEIFDVSSALDSYSGERVISMSELEGILSPERSKMERRTVSKPEFLEAMEKLSQNSIIGFWKWLHRNGVDYLLNRSHMGCLENTLKAMEFWESAPLSAHEALLDILQHSCDSNGFSNPLLNSHAAIVVDPTYLRTHPVLGSFVDKINLPGIRFRFLILRFFNSLLQRLLPIIDFRRSDFKSVGEMILNCRVFIFQKVKLDYIHKILDQTASSQRTAIPTVTLNRLELAKLKHESSHSFNFLNDSAFGISYSQLRDVDLFDLRPHRPVGTEPFLAFEVVFKGEHVVGEGGPYRQFFTDISSEIVDSSSSLFIDCPNKQVGVGDNRDKVIPKPSNSFSSKAMDLYNHLGLLMGCGIRTGVKLTLDFPQLFWKSLIGDSLDPLDLKEIDLVTYQVLKEFESDVMDERTFYQTCQDNFETVLSDHSKAELKENGSSTPVTYSNRREYAELSMQARLNESKPIMETIRSGIHKILPCQLLNLLTPREAEFLVSGKSKIDVALLERHTQYSGVSPDEEYVKMFWEILREFNEDDRRKFVKFAWAQERLPADDEEFERTHTRFLIKGCSFMDGVNVDSRFPKADTCFFNLELPAYSSKEIMREKLMFAINHTSSMNADEHAEDLHGANESSLLEF